MPLRNAGLRRHALTFALAAAVTSAFVAPSAIAASEGPWCGDRCDQVVLDWNQAGHQVIKAADGYSNPLTASRSLAMMHLAMHDAVNAVSPRYAVYASADASAYRFPAVHREGAAALAASVAAHDVLLALYPTQKELLAAMLGETLQDAGIGAAVDAAISSGRRAASALLAKRANDGSAGAEAYREGTAPGNYRFVPGTDFILMPHWRKVQPFGLRSPDQFRVAPPPAPDSVAYSKAFNEVKSSGGNTGVTTRTPDQAHYAAFWYEFSDAGWNRVARVVAREHKQNLWDRARTFALLNVALADSYIAGWDSKVHHDFWRPVTAIRAAAADGNPATGADADWNSFLPTPPIQDYPSTHSALGAAAAVVLAKAFGRDATAFSFASPTAAPGNPVRSFGSFSQAARENADSRVRAGLHFRFATDQGLVLGQQVGAYAYRTILGPRR